MLGALIAAGTSLASGLLQRSDNKKAQEREYERQKEFANSGIQWKVEDAKKAGIHPLYALGASTTSYSPQSVGDTGTGAMAQAGQDVSRAIHATRTPAQRVDAFTRTTQQLTLEKMGLENQLLAAQVAKVNQPATGPGLPGSESDYLISGQGNATNPATMLEEGFKRSPSRSGRPADELGTVSDRGFARTPHGGYAMVPSQDVKNRIEDMSLYEAQHFIRNNIMPMFSKNYQSPPFAAPAGKDWSYNALTGEYYLYNR